jgi:APA family basic amino acid/polyamine antiporter
MGLGGAVAMGLGSIVGSGVFVSIGVASGIAGPAVIAAIVLAAAVATFNALSSAQLAASHPVSGGTYEYGYRYLRPWLGFAAGWLFLCAKSASAATAALGFAGYLLNLLGHTNPPRQALVLIALSTVVGLTAIVLCGVRQSSRANAVIVSLTLLALLSFVVAGIPTALSNGSANLTNFSGTVVTSPASFWPALLQATALMFVAFTGYGRIATLGEEVHDPRITIPRAIGVTLWTSAALYFSVALVAVASTGAAVIAGSTGAGSPPHTAPLELAARRFGVPGVPAVVAIGAMTAMLGISLNLILGLSRVVLAMGRRRDLPAATARLNTTGTTPTVAVVLVGIVIAALTLVGDVKATSSFSAFTILIYYAITNLAALRLPPSDRLYARWLTWAGLFTCLSLAFWVTVPAWLTGCAVLAVGLLWHATTRRRRLRGDRTAPFDNRG